MGPRIEKGYDCGNGGCCAVIPLLILALFTYATIFAILSAIDHVYICKYRHNIVDFRYKEREFMELKNLYLTDTQLFDKIQDDDMVVKDDKLMRYLSKIDHMNDLDKVLTFIEKCNKFSDIGSIILPHVRLCNRHKIRSELKFEELLKMDCPNKY